MKYRTLSRVVPFVAAIAGITLVASGFGRAVAHQPNESLSESRRGPQWSEPFNADARPGYMMSQGHWGRDGMGGDRWGYGPQHGRMYDTDTVETVRGKVVSTDAFQPAAGMSPGMQISVDTGTETLPVHLGPRWFVDTQDFDLTPGQDIEVTGSRVSFGDRLTIVASEIRQGDAVAVLRDSDGFPTWSSRGRKVGR